MIRLIKQSRISRLYNSQILRYYGNLSYPFQYGVLRLHRSTLIFDVVFRTSRRVGIIVRYKVNGIQFLDLYRKTSVQNALLRLVLKHAKISVSKSL